MPLHIARKREVILLLALQIAHLIIISAQVPLHGRTTVLEAAVFNLLSPFQRATAATLTGIASFYHDYIGLRHARTENIDMRKRLDQALLELNRLRTKQQDVQRLEQLLRLGETLPYEMEPARVIGADSLNPMKTLFINKGLLARIRHNCPVISPEGFLVGRVVTPIAPSQATVQLLTDSEASVGAILANSRTYAIVSGIGNGRCLLRFVPSIVDVAPQEEVVTSGLDQIYPRGILIGRVVSSLTTGSVFKDITIQPVITPNQLEYVLVLTGEKPSGPDATANPN